MTGKALLRQWRWPLIGVALVLLALRMADGMVQDWGRLANGFDNLRAFWRESVWPPDWSVLQPQAYPSAPMRDGATSRVQPLTSGWLKP